MNTRDSLATHLNVFETFSPKIPEQYRSTPYVCLGNIAPSLQSDVLDGLHNPKLVVCDTMNFWIAGARVALEKVFARVDGVIINESEARELTGEPNLIAAGKKIQAIGPHVVVIKRGEHGATLFSGDKIFSAPAYPLERITDPTGAGDSFAGGFLGYVAKMNDTSFEALKRAVVYGSAVASFSVERFGANALGELTVEEIERRVAVLKTMSSW